MQKRQIGRAEAVEFFKALGFPKAGEWEDPKIREYLKQLPKQAKEDVIPESFKAFYRDVCAGKTSYDPKAKPQKPKPVKKPEVVKKEKASAKLSKDKWGARAGTIRAKVHAVLTSGFTSLEQISRASGVPVKQVAIRLKKCLRAGMVEKTRVAMFRLK